MNRYLFVSLLLLVSLVTFACAAQGPPEPSLVGSTAPDFSLDNTLGGQTSLSDYHGTSVLLFFHMAVG